MAQNHGVVKDTLTGLFCTSYNPTLSLCQWGNSDDAVLFETLQIAIDTANDMNSQVSAERFIGQNPPIR